MLKKKKNNKGFTLVELLVVIAIIGILAVVAVPALFSNINKAKIADMEADYSAYKSAALSYYTDTNLTTATTTQLGEYMESVPTENPFGGKYDLLEGKENADYKLALTAATNGKVKDGSKEFEKLQKDLGNEVVSVDSNGNLTFTLIK